MTDKKVNTEDVKVNAARSLLRRANKELSSTVSEKSYKNMKSGFLKKKIKAK